MSKLTLEDLDWSKAPEDAEEAATYGGKPYGMWYKDITPVGYCFRSTEERSWSSSTGEPLFKERIKRPANIFTKSMLVAGKHIVETREAGMYSISALHDDRRFLEGGAVNLSIEDYNADLTIGYGMPNTFDVIRIFTRLSKHSNKLIWERTPAKVPTQKELHLAALQDTINKAQEQIESLMKE